MRKAILWFVGIFAVVLVVTRTAEIIALADTVRSGSALLLLLAVILQVGRHGMTALTHTMAFRTVGVDASPRQFIPVVFGAMFVNTVMPTGGTAGSVLVVSDACHRGVEAGRATSATLLSQVAYYAGFALIMTIGFAILRAAGRLGTAEVVAGGVLVVILSAAVLLLFAGRPLLTRFLCGIERAIERTAALFSRTGPKPWALSVVDSFSDAASAIRSDPKGLAKVVGCATGGHLFDLATFAAVGAAFGFVEAGPLVAGYVVGILLTLVSVVPQGVGIVEAGVALLLTSYGVAGTIATAISLVFRGIVFWLPVGIGAVLLRRTKSFSVDSTQMREGVARFEGRLAAIFAAALGGATIVGSVLPKIPRGLEDVTGWVPPAPPMSNTSVIIAGFGLFLVARGLWRRKYLAWGMTLLLLLVTSIFLRMSGASWQSVAAPLVFAAWLFTERAVFVEPSDRPTVRQGVWAAALGTVFTLAYGTLGFWALEHQFELRYGLSRAFVQTVEMFFRFLNTGIVPVSGHGQWFVTSVYVVGIASAVSALAVAIAPMLIADYDEWKQRRAGRVR